MPKPFFRIVALWLAVALIAEPALSAPSFNSLCASLESGQDHKADQTALFSSEAFANRVLNMRPAWASHFLAGLDRDVQVAPLPTLPGATPMAPATVEKSGVVLDSAWSFLGMAKGSLLAGLYYGGWVRLWMHTPWRQHRLAILCYHGVALDDEHAWSPRLYVSPEHFERDLKLLRDLDCHVLPLEKALELLRQGRLPPRSVVLTFDDGFYDFYEKAFPLLKKYQFPATVYMSTYYSQFNRPVFDVICPYLFWKTRKRVLEPRGLPGLENLPGLEEPLSLSSPESRAATAKRIQNLAEDQKLNGAQKEELVAQLAERLGFDYQEIRRRRILHLMTPEEIRELAKEGIDFQLHTHRHRFPEDPSLLAGEIEENRRVIESLTGRSANHFCYPNGVVSETALSRLRNERIDSAVTTDPGLATPKSPVLLIPRYSPSDNTSVAALGGMLSGLIDFLPNRPPSGANLMRLLPLIGWLTRIAFFVLAFSESLQPGVPRVLLMLTVTSVEVYSLLCRLARCAEEKTPWRLFASELALHGAVLFLIAKAWLRLSLPAATPTIVPDDDYLPDDFLIAGLLPFHRSPRLAAPAGTTLWPSRPSFLAAA